jgi:hypothetical protein
VKTNSITLFLGILRRYIFCSFGQGLSLFVFGIDIMAIWALYFIVYWASQATQRMKKLLLSFFLLLPFCESLVAQSTTIKTNNLPIERDSVWMLTYFRQRYPTRIEINAKGETVEVPLPNPMLVA